MMLLLFYVQERRINKILLQQLQNLGERKTLDKVKTNRGARSRKSKILGYLYHAFDKLPLTNSQFHQYKTPNGEPRKQQQCYFTSTPVECRREVQLDKEHW